MLLYVYSSDTTLNPLRAFGRKADMHIFFFFCLFCSEMHICSNDFILCTTCEIKWKLDKPNGGLVIGLRLPRSYDFFLHLLDPRLNFWLFNAEIIRFRSQCLFVFISQLCSEVRLPEFEMLEGQTWLTGYLFIYLFEDVLRTGRWDKNRFVHKSKISGWKSEETMLSAVIR